MTNKVIVTSLLFLTNYIADGRTGMSFAERADHVSKLASLEDIYRTYNRTPGYHKYEQYATMYEKNIGHLRRHAVGREKNVKVLEIGVQNGGSAEIWNMYFGNRLFYVGIDTNPKCIQFVDSKRNIYVEIGSQLNISFLNYICQKYGRFDLIVDDGAHTTESILTSLKLLWFCMINRGVYAIEDLHTMVRKFYPYMKYLIICIYP